MGAGVCYGECSEAKDHVEQLSNVKECIVLLSVVVLCSYQTCSHSSSLFT
jgi:hypothetical protein